MAIVFDRVGFAFPDGTRVLESLSLEIREGDFVGIVGPNGSGKTTFARLVNASLLPTRGAVRIDDLDTGVLQDQRGIRQRVAVIGADPVNQMITTSVFDEIAFALQAQGLERQEIVERTQIAIKAYDLTAFMSIHPGFLSMGEQFQVLLAATWARGAKYLVLDEVTGMLDSHAREHLFSDLASLIKGKGTTVVLISHRLEDLAKCDLAYILHAGRVRAEDIPDNVCKLVRSHPEWGLALPSTWEIALHLGLDYDVLLSKIPIWSQVD